MVKTSQLQVFTDAAVAVSVKACWALESLATLAINRRLMVDAGVISGLKYLLVSGAINARIQAGWTLRNVVIDGKYGSLYSFKDKKSLVLTGGCIQPLLEIVRSKVFYANDVALEGNSSLRFSHFDFEIIKKDDLGDILEEREQAFVILARTSTDGATSRFIMEAGALPFLITAANAAINDSIHSLDKSFQTRLESIRQASRTVVSNVEKCVVSRQYEN